MANAVYSDALTSKKDSDLIDAPLWSRFAAWAIDLAVNIVLPYLLAVTVAVIFFAVRSLLGGKPFDVVTSISHTLFPTNLWQTFKVIAKAQNPQFNPSFVAISAAAVLDEFFYVLPLTLLLIIIFFSINHLFLATVNGKTIGKQLMGLKIVTTDGQQPDFVTILLRHLPGQFLSSILFFLGYAYALVNPERRAFHDYLAQTRVVEDETFKPQIQPGGAVSSILAHFGFIGLAVFLAYFLQLMAILLRIWGVPIPAFLLPTQPKVAPPIEFTIINKPNSNKGKTKLTKPRKRIAAVTSVAGGKTADPKKQVSAGKAASTSSPKPTPKPQPVVEKAPTPPKPSPKPRRIQSAPVVTRPKRISKVMSPQVVTTPKPSPVTAESSTTPPETRTRKSRDFGQSLASNPTPQNDDTRPTRRSSSSALGGPLSKSARQSNDGTGGKGDNPLFNPDRTGSGEGIDASEDVNFGPYMNRIQSKVRRYWLTPEENNSKRTLLSFMLDTKGRLSKLRVLRSSGNPDTDQAAMDAVRQAAPFPPLPAGADSSISIKFSFDINVLGADYDPRGY